MREKIDMEKAPAVRGLQSYFVLKVNRIVAGSEMDSSSVRQYVRTLRGMNPIFLSAVM